MPSGMDGRSNPAWLVEIEVGVRIAAIAHYQITDAKAATYNVESIEQTMTRVNATSLQTAISDMTLNKVLGRHDALRSGVQDALDASTQSWGFKVNQVEIREIVPLDGI